MVYRHSSSSVYPGLLVTGRVPSDPANTLQTPATIKSGTASDTSTRYEDYFSAATDPTATFNSVFWVAGEYRTSSDPISWNTAIAQVASYGAPTNFALSAADYQLSLYPDYESGGSTGTTLTATLTGGPTSSVTFSASGWCCYVSLNPTSVYPTASSSVTFYVPPGHIFRHSVTCYLVVTATGFSETHSVTIAVTVEQNCFCVLRPPP